MDNRTKWWDAKDESPAVAYALAQVGKTYKFRTPVECSTDAPTFDCSGLTRCALEAVGLTVEHNAALQAVWFDNHNRLVEATPENRLRLVPGDWVGWYASYQDPESIPHCGLYVGRGWFGRYMVVAAVDDAYGVMLHRMNWALKPSCFGYVRHT